MDLSKAGKRVFYRFEGIDETVCAGDVEILGAERFDEEIVRPERAEVKKPGFWRRQFGTAVTRQQRRMDWLFGVFMPLVCFYFDPIVFRSGYWIDPDSQSNELLGEYRAMAYVFCFVSIMTLSGFLLWGERLRWLNAMVAGVLFASALAAFAIGVVIFPFSLLGLVVFIGILGFTPLLTTVVYARNAVRASRGASLYFDKLTLFHVAALSGAAALALPFIFGR